MTRPADNAGPDPDLDRLAAEWALRERAGLGAPDRRALDEWLRDPGHAAAFAEMKLTSGLLDGLREPGAAEVEAPRARRSSRVYWLAAALTAAAAVLIWMAPAFSPVSAPETLVEMASTEVGEFKTLDLPDGSVVRLNTRSTAEVVYSQVERRIKLTRGEAFFTVAKNPSRPFWVEAGPVSVRAVGTAFNVRYRGEAVEVLVQEGRVQVCQPGAAETAAQLAAGEKALVPLPAAAAPGPVVVIPVESARLQSALAWQARRLEFTETPLGDVVAEFNRYNRHQLVVGDATLATQTFGGVFTASGYTSLIEVLEQNFGVVAERRGDMTILRRKAR